MTETYVDKTTGKVIGMMSDNHPNPPPNSFIATVEPKGGKDVWDFKKKEWIEHIYPKPRSVSKLIDSLIKKGIITKEDVEKDV